MRPEHFPKCPSISLIKDLEQSARARQPQHLGLAGGVQPVAQLPVCGQGLEGVALLGAVAGLCAVQTLPVAVAVLVGWDVAAVTLLLWVWLVVGRYDASATRERATREDNNRFAIWVFLLAASTASLLGAGIVQTALFFQPLNGLGYDLLRGREANRRNTRQPIADFLAQVGNMR